MNINEFFNTLAINPSRNYKIDCLQANVNNETLRNVIRLALDPFTQFYIRKIPKYMTGSVPKRTLEKAMDNLYSLSSRQVTGHEGIAWLTDILETLSADDAKVIERIIQKDLKCGVSTSTANTVWSKLIKEYPVMLCSGYEEKLVDKIPFPAYVQLKEDGMRFNAIVKDGKVEFKSRNGKTIELLGNLSQDFVTMAGDVDCVFDGELLVKDTGEILKRQIGNGILNKAVKGTISAAEAAMVCATVWDYIPYAHFVDGYCPLTYENRFETLTIVVEEYNTSRISIVPNNIVNNVEEVHTLFNQYYSSGEEGIILKDVNGVWENKRSKSQIKFKGELECDLLITGIEEGSGKYEGLLGSILCESADGKIKVSVGSGLTDALRTSLNSEDIIGRIIAIKYNARIKNKQGEESLFLPIFLEIREDKTEADNSDALGSSHC